MFYKSHNILHRSTPHTLHTYHRTFHHIHTQIFPKSNLKDTSKSLQLFKNTLQYKHTLLFHPIHTLKHNLYNGILKGVYKIYKKDDKLIQKNFVLHHHKKDIFLHDILNSIHTHYITLHILNKTIQMHL